MWRAAASTAMALSPQLHNAVTAPFTSRQRVVVFGGPRKPLLELGNWQFVSGSFGMNAIGSLLMDPEPIRRAILFTPALATLTLRSIRKLAWAFIKTTDGGSTFGASPRAADIFFQRGIGQMALDNATGNLLVPIGSAVRGVSSVTSGASSSGSTGHPLVTRGLYRCNGVILHADPGRLWRGDCSRLDHREGRSDSSRGHLC